MTVSDRIFKAGGKLISPCQWQDEGIAINNNSL